MIPSRDNTTWSVLVGIFPQRASRSTLIPIYCQENLHCFLMESLHVCTSQYFLLKFKLLEAKTRVSGKAGEKREKEGEGKRIERRRGKTMTSGYRGPLNKSLSL